MKSRIFYTDVYKKIQHKTRHLLNTQPDFLSKNTIGSTRATGDAIQHILKEGFRKVLGNLVKDYSADFARRAMADLAFTDQDNLSYIIDVKTHRLETKFNMPNLTSVRRLARLYKDDKEYFVILMVKYNVVSQTSIRVKDVLFVPIEFLSWDCLTIGALGWGQIQIANANRIVVNHKYSRKRWMLDMCETLFEFYPREIAKVRDRITYFKKVKNNWTDKTDVWQ